VNNEAIYQLARQFEAYPDSSKIPTLRGTGIIEFAAALLSQHEAEKRPPAPGAALNTLAIGRLAS
jgi:hypothetical protein